MDNVIAISQLLADGKFHSGTALARRLNMTRAGVWKIINQLPEYGLQVERHQKLGYRLSSEIHFLDQQKIQSLLAEETKNTFQSLEIFHSLDSTNTYLLKKLRQQAVKSGSVVLSEHQSQGRGRLNRHWLSPYAANIYCSFYYRFQLDPAELGIFSLAVGLAIAKALVAYGLDTKLLTIKWPNDIYYAGKKLAGILTEMLAQPHQFTEVVCGFGINVNMSHDPNIKLDQAWCDIRQITQQAPDRNVLLAGVLNQLSEMIVQIQQRKFSAILKDWAKYDYLLDKPVDVVQGEQKFSGVVKGIDEHGAIIIQQASGKKIAYLSGEVNLKLQS